MKIAVAAIAKNEAQFVQRWADSAVEADYRFILDTGSNDDTIQEIVLNNTIVWEQKVVSPWRFDDARNYALSRLPDDIDYVIWLDMDEILVEGWRDALELVPANITRPRYKYVWSWNPDESEGLVYGGDKIHARHGYRWKHPVHEVLVGENETQMFIDGFEIHHYPDHSKSRGQYFDLLKLAVQEDPDDDRNQFYLGREYYFNNDYPNATKHLILHTLLSKWAPEKAASYRLLYKMNGNLVNLYRALAEDPTRRENLVALAQHYHNSKEWAACLQFAKAAIDIKDKPLDYLCEPLAWSFLPYDLAALACYHLGRKDDAYYYGYKACNLEPNNPRLENNLKFYLK